MLRSVLKGRKIFLIDAIGALVSSCSLLIPYSFEKAFGMPESTVFCFIVIALACAVYSITIHFSSIKNWKPYLRIIALINSSYCLITAYHLYVNCQTLTLLGYTYFAVEIGIICFISVIELALSSTPDS